jgi:hypothetical protein
MASEPLISGAALKPGVHLDLVGAYRPDMREADALALQRALLVVDTRAGGLAEAGDVVQAIAEGAITPAHVVADLAEPCRGTHPGGRALIRSPPSNPSAGPGRIWRRRCWLMADKAPSFHVKLFLNPTVTQTSAPTPPDPASARWLHLKGISWRLIFGREIGGCASWF